MILKSMAIPLSDTIFTDRVERVEYRGALKVVNSLIQRLELLTHYPQLLQM